jgi:chromosome segregation ATPase
MAVRDLVYALTELEREISKTKGDIRELEEAVKDKEQELSALDLDRDRLGELEEWREYVSGCVREMAEKMKRLSDDLWVQTQRPTMAEVVRKVYLELHETIREWSTDLERIENGP